MNRVSPLRAAVDLSAIQSAWIDTLLQFVSWSQGHCPLKSVLSDFAQHFGAQAVCMSRREQTPERVRIIQIYDPNKDAVKPKLSRSYSLEAVGGALDQLKVGTAVLIGP